MSSISLQVSDGSQFQLNDGDNGSPFNAKANTSGFLVFLVKCYDEAIKLIAQLKGDVGTIEGSDLKKLLAAWKNLFAGLAKEFPDLFSQNNAYTKNLISGIQGDAKKYVAGIKLQVRQPNTHSGWINLYLSQNDAHAATLLDALNGVIKTLYTDPYDCYFDNAGGWRPGLGTKWSAGGHLGHSSFWDGNGNDNGEYCTASGSLADWAPYIHLSAGDAGAKNAMNNAVNGLD